MGNNKANATKTTTRTTNTHTEQGNQQSGSDNHGAVPPSPASSASPTPLASAMMPLKLWRKSERAPAKRFPHGQLAGQRRYGTSRASAASISRGKNINFTNARVPDSSSSQHRPASTAASPAGLPPSTSSSKSGRHDTCICGKPTDSSATCYKVHGAMPATGACASGVAPSTRARETTLHAPLRRRRGSALRTPLPSAMALFKRRGPTSRAPLPSALARESTHQAPPPPATRRAVTRVLHLHVASFSKGVLRLPLLAMRRWSV